MKRNLPFIAAISLVLALVCLALVARQRGEALRDTGETTQAVEAAVAKIQALRPDALESPQFQEAVRQLAATRPVAQVWLIGADGQIRFSTARYANHGSVEQWALPETQRVVSEMPAGFLTDRQRVALLAASAIQREGEHNDVLHHMIRPLRSHGDAEAGFLGLAYDVSAKAGAFPGFGYVAALFLALIGLAVYWLTLPWWVFLDARPRGERAWAWALFVLLGNLVALLAYVLARHPAVQERLAAES